MYIFCIVLIVLASILMILAVLVQNPKSGMAANFSASNQVLGARSTSSFLERFTWSTALVIFALSVLVTALIPSDSGVSGSSILEQTIKDEQVEVPSFTIPEGTPSQPDSTK